MPIKLLFQLILFAFLISCNQDSQKEVTSTSSSSSSQASGFTKINNSISGIDFINSLEDNPLSDRNVLSYQHYFNGAGVGVADFNLDGLQDIFFAGNEVNNEIYINNGDMKFEKLPATSGINKNKVWSSGVSIVDINSDGYPDVYVCQQGPYEKDQRKNCFYINNGDLTFTELAGEMGLDDSNYSTQATFFDYDKDGDLDCYVMNESKYAGIILADVFKDLKKPGKMEEASGKMYENKGNLIFKDVTQKAGMLKYGYGLGLAVSDFNGDNWPDVYVANDYTVPDFMYINQKDGTFKEQVADYTRQTSYFGMGCDVADINNDTLVDIGVVDMAAEDHFRDKTLMASMNVELFDYYFNQLGYHLQYMFNSLQLNNGNNTFSNIAAMAGVLKSDWSWAAMFVDFNLDGHKDFYVTNGFRRYARDNDFRKKMEKIRNANQGTVPLNRRAELYKLMPQIKLKNKLYVHDGDLHFNDESKAMSHPDIKTYSYGAAHADFDNDGDQDLIINNIDQEALLLKNETVEKTSHNYIKIRLDEINSAKKLGAKVTIKVGNVSQLQEYFFVRGYESTMEESLNFGLGAADKVDEIKIVWPDNNVQILKDVAANQVLKIKYAKGTEYKIPSKNEGMFKEVSAASLGIDFVHKENQFDDFDKEILLPQRQTAFGPALAAGDINGDGLDDIYIGGAKDQPGTLYEQKLNGQFSQYASQPWRAEAYSEDTDAVFVDANQDGHMDLIILSGGSGDFVGEEVKLLDRFYANDGKGNFFRIANVLPNINMASNKIIVSNIDDDPDNELLIVGGAQPGKYPMHETSLVLDYQNNKYVDVTSEIVPELNDPDGILRDAIWTDINGDGMVDLLTAGEWQNIRSFINTEGVFREKTNSWALADKKGWWRSIQAGDFDNDGDIDIIAGNVGVNFKQKASDKKPLFLYSNDFDNNGTLDCVLAKDYNGTIVPARGKECSSQQMPFVSEKFPSYTEFASASLVDIYGETKLEEGIELEANDFHSYVLWNDGGQFSWSQLPQLAQSAPISDIVTLDVNQDGNLDILFAGNDYNTEYETPRLDAGNGMLLLNKGNQKWETTTIAESGIYAPGEVKKIAPIKTLKGSLFIFANNNAAPVIFSK